MSVMKPYQYNRVTRSWWHASIFLLLILGLVPPSSAESQPLNVMVALPDFKNMIEEALQAS